MAPRGRVRMLVFVEVTTGKGAAVPVSVLRSGSFGESPRNCSPTMRSQHNEGKIDRLARTRSSEVDAKSLARTRIADATPMSPKRLARSQTCPSTCQSMHHFKTLRQSWESDASLDRETLETIERDFLLLAGPAPHSLSKSHSSLSPRQSLEKIEEGVDDDECPRTKQLSAHKSNVGSFPDVCALLTSLLKSLQPLLMSNRRTSARFFAGQTQPQRTS